MKRLLSLALFVAWTGALPAGERDVVKPLLGDKLIPARLTHQELTGGEIDRRIMELIHSNYMVLPEPRSVLARVGGSLTPEDLEQNRARQPITAISIRSKHLPTRGCVRWLRGLKIELARETARTDVRK